MISNLVIWTSISKFDLLALFFCLYISWFLKLQNPFTCNFIIPFPLILHNYIYIFVKRKRSWSWGRGHECMSWKRKQIELFHVKTREVKKKTGIYRNAPTFVKKQRYLRPHVRLRAEWHFPFHDFSFLERLQHTLIRSLLIILPWKYISIIACVSKYTKEGGVSSYHHHPHISFFFAHSLPPPQSLFFPFSTLRNLVKFPLHYFTFLFLTHLKSSFIYVKNLIVQKKKKMWVG